VTINPKLLSQIRDKEVAEAEEAEENARKERAEAVAALARKREAEEAAEKVCLPISCAGCLPTCLLSCFLLAAYLNSFPQFRLFASRVCRPVYGVDLEQSSPMLMYRKRSIPLASEEIHSACFRRDPFRLLPKRSIPLASED
jgi:hypothetical protein